MEEQRPKIQNDRCSAEALDAGIAITADERATWLVDHVVSHWSDDRIHLLRRAVEQITAAEAEAYERGWRDALKSVEVKAPRLLTWLGLSFTNGKRPGARLER
jgi:hypothetical protein